jgi:flagella basal body P-ring formation protein FlgA
MRFVLIFVAASLTHAACISVPRAKILAGDLAAAVPLFSQIAPDVEIGFSPMPGTQRLLTGHELLAIATRNGTSSPADSPVAGVCVERATRSLSADEIRPLLLSALAMDGVQLEITDVSAQPVPPGRLEFRREGLDRPRTSDPSMPVIWRGRLVYDGVHSLAIWAKVRLILEREIIVAAEEIPAGSVIEAGQLKTISAQRFPLPGPVVAAIERMAGKVSRKKFAAGEEVVASVLVDPMDVMSGDAVQVRVTDGGAELSLNGIAQGSGRKGQAIVIHNPSSGKNFRALIEGRKQVVVRSAPGAAL